MAADCPAFFSYTGGILTTDCVSGEPDQSVCSVRTNCPPWEVMPNVRTVLCC
jgi:hypothetical protein